jgi:hypothetical protein
LNTRERNSVACRQLAVGKLGGRHPESRKEFEILFLDDERVMIVNS